MNKGLAVIDTKRNKIELATADLTPSEVSIVKAGVNPTISEYKQEALLDKVTVLTKFIARDYGIAKQPDKYDATRFLMILRNYYGTLTLEEIKLAFELAAVGELDAYLPKDRNGEPDKNHYQSFSVEYLTKIIKAYKTRRGVTWSAVNRSAANESMKRIAATVDKEAIKQEYLNTLYEVFDAFKENGEMSNVLPYRQIHKQLLELGLCEGLEEPSQEDINAAREIIGSDEGKSRFQRAMILRRETNGESEDVDAIVLGQKAKQAVRECFMNLIIEDTHLRDKLS